MNFTNKSLAQIIRIIGNRIEFPIEVQASRDWEVIAVTVKIKAPNLTVRYHENIDLEEAETLEDIDQMITLFKLDLQEFLKHLGV